MFFLSDEAELLCIDSRRMSFRAARRIVIRCRRPDSDTLDVVMFNHKHAPELPDGVRRVDRLVGRAQLVRIDPADLFELAERRSHERNTF